MNIEVIFPLNKKVIPQFTTFPDSQKLIKTTAPEFAKYMVGADYCTIRARINNFNVFEELAQVVQVIRYVNPLYPIELEVTYLIGGRSDKTIDGFNYVKDISCAIINSMKFEQVTIYDPHSEITKDNLADVMVDTYLEDLFALFLSDLKLEIPAEGKRKVQIVIPDKGAKERVESVIDEFHQQVQISTINFEKERNQATGKIIRLFTKDAFNPTVPTVVIDDICDAGGTFIGISDALSEVENKYLIVSHGIFSKGFEELEKHYKQIYCTNSYSDYIPHRVLSVKRVIF